MTVQGIVMGFYVIYQQSATHKCEVEGNWYDLVKKKKIWKVWNEFVFIPTYYNGKWNPVLPIAFSPEMSPSV